MSNGLNIPLAGNSALALINSLVRGRLTPIIYALSSVTTAVAQLAAGVVILHWIAPEELGLWKIVQVAQVYAFILLAGVNNGLGRELPFFLGKGDQMFADRLAGTALFCVTLANLMVVVCGIVSAIVFAKHGAHLVWAILATMLQIVFTFYRHIFTITFRSKDSFNKLTMIQFAEAGLSLGTVPMVYFFHYEGMLARTVVVAGVVGLLIFIYRPMRVKVSLDWKALKLLMKTGFPIFGLDYLKNSAGTTDRMVLMELGGVDKVGVYQLAGTGLQTLAAVSSSLASYLYPRMTYDYGRDGNARALWRSGCKFVMLTVSLTAFAAGCAWLALPLAVPVFAAKYFAGLHAARIVLAAGVFESAAIISNALLSLKAWKLLVIHQILSAALYALGPILGIVLISRTLEGVAWGAVLGSAGRCVSALLLTYCATHHSAHRGGRA